MKSKITKEQLKEYLYDNWDVILDQILEELPAGEQDIPKLKEWLKELEDEDWVIKSHCASHDVDEYGPSDAQIN